MAIVKKLVMVLTLTLALLLSTNAVGRQMVNLAVAQTSAIVIIDDDGSVEGTDRIQWQGIVYTLTGNISGSIQVQKSNIVIDGAGFTLQGNGGTGIDLSSEAEEHPSNLDIRNVTVKNLRITNCHIGIKCEFGGNHNFYGDYISNDFVTQNGTGIFSGDSLGIAFWGSSGNNITHCTVGGSPAIYMHFAVSGNIVVENNIVFGAHLALSGDETFDRNYWSDYLTRYPNASEVDSSGVWDMPYAFPDSIGFEKRVFHDNHPLVSPLSIPNFSFVLPIVQSVQGPTIALTAAPIISILSPSGTYTIPKANEDSMDIPLTFTVKEPVSWMKYRLVGSGFTGELTPITGNTTFLDVSSGVYLLQIYANDMKTYASSRFDVEASPQEPKPFLTTNATIASIVMTVIIGVVLSVYFRKRHKLERE